MTSLVHIETPRFTNYTKTAIYEIKLKTGKSVLMKYRERLENNDKYGVVIVNAAKFHELWKLEPEPIDEHKVLSHGNCGTWYKDRKFHKKDEEFSNSRDNPVSLARVYCEAATRNILSIKTQRKYLVFSKRIGSLRKFHYCYVSINDGLTRTVWLLSQGAESFPVECEMPGARLLFEQAGQKGSDFKTDKSLFK